MIGGLGGAKFENGKLVFPFTVGGTFAKPKFSVSGVGGAGGASKLAAEEPANVVKGLSGLLRKKKQ